jgi:hypothetical protein
LSMSGAGFFEKQYYCPGLFTGRLSIFSFRQPRQHRFFR